MNLSTTEDTTSLSRKPSARWIHEGGTSPIDRDAAAVGRAALIGGYIFNFKRTGLQPGTYELHVRAAGDSNDHVIRFQIR